MKLVIVRHGETYDNLEDLLTGQKDVELTTKGKKQAKELIEKINHIKFDIIYCSTLKRAKDTIEPYKRNHEIDIIYTDEMMEMNLGIYNGAKPEDAIYERSKGLFHKVGGGESLTDLYNRAADFLKQIKSKHKNDTVLLVGHNAINRNIIGIIKKYSIKKINDKKERYANTSVLEFEIF